MKIVVLAGGLSPERDVSLSSGALIANALMDNGNEVCYVDLYKPVEREPEHFSELFYTKEDGKVFQYCVPKTEPDLATLKAEYGDGNKKIGKNVLELCAYADVVFVALHGDIGENGQLQATFDNYGICYTGSGFVGSLLAMDKVLAKKMMSYDGILNAPWILIRKGQTLPEMAFPCVVKPLNCGSSIGVSVVKSREELEAALTYAHQYADDILIETYIPGRELQVGVLKGQALPVIEIIPTGGFYDYQNKYQAGMAKEVCPAELSEDKTKEIQEIALRVHECLNLGIYSRIDFIMDRQGDIYCLEANTLPGMTPTSLIPQEAKAAGITYHELCQMIVEAAEK